MRVAIVHYHRRPGGVASVIDATLQALGDQVQAAVLVGGPAGARATPPYRLTPGLDYTDGLPQVGAAHLADVLEQAASAALQGRPDLWHIHNHALGKHPAATAAFAELGRRGHRLLLHLHDFAEDGRPADYGRLRAALGADLARLLYPAGSHIHYAALNRRDHSLLGRAGIPEERLHLLPNPVRPPGGDPSPAPADGPILYPTRAIRRKNIGEALLWSALASPGQRFALTLAPTTPRDAVPYERWRAFAAHHELPVQFAVGAAPGADYPSLVRSASAFLTTSVAEGFGLAFLEPWLSQRPLAGRNLPELTADFAREGLRVHHLYDALLVPEDWIDAATLRSRVETALAELHRQAGRPLPPDAAARARAAMGTGTHLDFGRLDEEMQETVIARLLADPAQRAHLHPPRLDTAPPPADLAHNRRIARARYSLPSYGARLLGVYRDLAAERVGPQGSHDAERVLDFFLDPARLQLLRT
jgi:glycosyltransferase involved in cell wall biosynthesis